jgi:hypothetical protein
VTHLSASPGANLTIADSGFDANQQITPILDNNTLSTSMPVKTDSNSTFNINATLPKDIQAGRHDITAKDSSGVKAIAHISVESSSTQPM